MKLIQELFKLIEAEEQKPLELADVVKYFPNTYRKVIDNLWGTSRLQYHGTPLLVHSDTMNTKNKYEDPNTVAYYIEEAVDKYMENGDFQVDFSTIEYHPENDGGISSMYDGDENAVQDLKAKIRTKMSMDNTDPDPIDLNISIDYEMTWELYKEDAYLGYNPKTDEFLIVYNAFLSEEVFNQEWDEQFKEQTGEDFDHDLPNHKKAFDAAWEEWKNTHFKRCLVFTVKDKNDGVDFIVSEFQSKEGSFNESFYSTGFTKHDGFIDLTVD